MRSKGYPISARLNDIENEICFHLNIGRFFRNGTYEKRLAEALKIMNALPRRGETPLGVDGGKYEFLRGKELPVWRTDGFLKARILSVGLKSYPYLIDFDRDGRKDLLVGDHDGFIYFYKNYGTREKPSYRTGKRLKSASTGKAFAIRFNPKLNFADMNGDGKKDIVLGSYDGKPYMLPNRASRAGNFLFDDRQYTTFKTADSVLNVGNYVYPFVLDWNRDGLADIATGEIEGKIHLHINAGTRENPVFKAAVEIAAIAPDMYPDPVLWDMNGDGKTDLLAGSRSGKIYYFENRGTVDRPGFVLKGYLKAGGKDIYSGRLSHIHIADWNNDGVADLLLGNDKGEVRVLKGEKNKKTDAAISFAPPLLLKTAEPVELISGVHPVVCFKDWNGDGKIDILAGGAGPGLRFYPNVGTARRPVFEDYSPVPGVEMKAGAFAKHCDAEKSYWQLKGLAFITEYLGNCSPECVDWDNDGRLDLLVGSYTGLIYFYKNIGTRTAPKLASPKALKAGGKLLRVPGYSTPRAVDWNNDGRLDLISGDLAGQIHVFINKNTNGGTLPELEKSFCIKLGGKPVSLWPRTIVDFSDLNGDGRKDLIIGNRFGKVYAMMNKGTPDSPAFSEIEILQDKSDIWEKLYGGGWAGPRPVFPLRWKRGREISDMALIATSCPRFVDFDQDGEKELMVSHRFGRIFIFKKAPSRPE